MKYNFETKYMTASTDSTAVAKRLILIIEDMEKLESGKPDPAIEAYLHDTPRAKSEFGAGDAYRVPNINGEPNPAAGPFKGAIVIPDPLAEPKKYIEPLKKRVKEDTPAMNITSRLHDEKYGDEIHDGGNCVETDKGCVIMKATKPAKGEKWPHEKFTSDEYPPENIEDEDIEIDDEPEQRVPEQIDASTTGDIVSTDMVPDTTGKYPSENSHPKKVKSSEIVPQEGTVEEAYMGEHFEVAPDDPEEKPLTPAEQELWDYIQKNPQYTMTSACRDLKITTANYYWRKRQLFLKGRKVGGTIAFAKKAED